jgi:nucleoside-diphosphate-sugar epimerase
MQQGICARNRNHGASCDYRVDFVAFCELPRKTREKCENARPAPVQKSFLSNEDVVMRILVIGGTGFIGTHLLRELTAAGHEVAILHRNRSKGDVPKSVTHIAGDRNRLQDSRDDLRRFAPEVVIDLILSSGAQAKQLMNAIRHVARRVVAISSMDVYRAWGVLHRIESGALEPLPITEDSRLRSVRQLYPPEVIRAMQGLLAWVTEDYDKIAVEEVVMSDPKLLGTVLRLPMIYGPGDTFHRLWPFVKRMDDHRPAILFADDLAAWRGPRGYVENVAHAIADASTSEKAAGRIYNVCEEPVPSDLEFAKRIAPMTGWSGRFVLLPHERTPKHLLVRDGNTAQNVVASSKRIRDELGYREIVSFDEGLRRTIDWERANPPGDLPFAKFDYEAEDAALNEAAGLQSSVCSHQ